MKLWLLRPADVIEIADDPQWAIDSDLPPWAPWYDKAFGFIVRTETESEARLLAREAAGDEGDVWLDPVMVRCDHLTDDGAAGIIMRDFHLA